MYQQPTRWTLIRRQVLRTVGIIVVLALLISIFGGYYFGWEWTGFDKDADFRMRTLWDWMKLLFIPVVIAGGTIWFNQRQHVRQQEAEEKQLRHDAMVQALQEEKESVAHVAMQLRQERLPADKQRRAQLFTALLLAMLYQNSDRTRALVLSAIKDSYTAGYGNEVQDTLTQIEQDFEFYKQRVEPQPEFKANIGKHINKLKALRKALP